MRHIGFIGLGTMGAPMALNLLKHGYSLTVWEGSHAASRLAAAGAQTAPTPQAIAAASECVITMLPEPADDEAVVTRPDGIAAGIRRDAVYIDMSTIDPETTRRVGAVVAARKLPPSCLQERMQERCSPAWKRAGRSLPVIQ